MSVLKFPENFKCTKSLALVDRSGVLNSGYIQLFIPSKCVYIDIADPGHFCDICVRVPVTISKPNSKYMALIPIKDCWQTVYEYSTAIYALLLTPSRMSNLFS